MGAAFRILAVPGRYESSEPFAYVMHEYYMQMALAQAEAALADDEVPVGAIIVRSDSAEGEVVVGAAHNQRERLRDPTAHAEIIAITQAAVAMRDWRLSGCTLYVTLEPCAMCAGAILQARIDRVVYGAADPKAGAVDSLYELLRDERLNHRVETIGGIFDDRCGAILTQFFVQQRREGKK